MRFVFFPEDFNLYSDEIDIIGLIFVSIPDFTPDLMFNYR